MGASRRGASCVRSESDETISATGILIGPEERAAVDRGRLNGHRVRHQAVDDRQHQQHEADDAEPDERVVDRSEPGFATRVQVVDILDRCFQILRRHGPLLSTPLRTVDDPRDDFANVEGCARRFGCGGGL
jgi:hypothetical protein